MDGIVRLILHDINANEGALGELVNRVIKVHGDWKEWVCGETVKCSMSCDAMRRLTDWTDISQGNSTMFIKYLPWAFAISRELPRLS
jgi:hypothetical protein